MKFTQASLVLAASVASVSAYALPGESTHTHSRRASERAVGIVLAAAPGSSTCSTATQFTDECIEAKDATQPILNGLYRYGVTTAAEQAAVLSWMTFETGDFKFNKHHFGPVNPGQGTRCMMGPNFVREYASSLPDIAGQVANTQDPEAVLALVLDNERSFGAAPWFYSNKCSQGVKDGVKRGDMAGYTSFMTECIGTTMTDERGAKYRAAMNALGLQV